MAESFGAYIRRIREELGHSQRWVGVTSKRLPDKREHISGSYLSQLERDDEQHPSPNKIRGLAKIYRLDYEDLLRRASYLPGATKEARVKPRTKAEMREELFAYMDDMGFTPAEKAGVDLALSIADKLEEARPKKKRGKRSSG